MQPGSPCITAILLFMALCTIVGPAGASDGSTQGEIQTPGSGSSTYTLSGTYTLSTGTATLTNGTFTSSTTDVSAVYVSNSADLTLINPTIITSGGTSSNDDSSFYGLNAAVLATSGSKITITGGTIITTGSGANGAFPTGSGTSITLSNVTITASGGGGHGVMATNEGILTLNNVNITTSGANSAPLATDRGSGTVTVTGGVVTSSGTDSPGIYSTGDIKITGGTISATGSEGAVVEGFNSITLNDTVLSGAKGTRDRGVMLYQSMSGDAESGTASFTMNGGSFTWPSTTGPAFYVTNTEAVITLTGLTVTSSSGTLLKASAGDWGTSGSNGGTATFIADGVTLTGSLTSDSISSIMATLKNGTTLTGAINSAALSIDASSTWQVTGNSVLTTLADSSGISGTTISNIAGNGYIVYYNSALSGNTYLGGKTYTLVNGGTLTPSGSVTPTATTTPTTSNPVPVARSLSPAIVPHGSPDTNVTITGMKFIAGSLVWWNGIATAWPQYFISATSMNLTVPSTFFAQPAGTTAKVQVFNPAPRGGKSANLTLTVGQPVPSVTTLDPEEGVAGAKGLLLRVQGSDFVAGAKVLWNGAAKTPSAANISSTSITLWIPGTDLATAKENIVIVKNPAPGSPVSGPATFPVKNPVPVITAVSPTTVYAGGTAFTLVVNGKNFTKTSRIQWNGINKTSLLTSTSKLTAKITADNIKTPGTAEVTTLNPAPGGSTSSSVQFTIMNPQPVITSISPPKKTLNSAGFNLTVAGKNFTAASVVQWNGVNKTTWFSNSRLLKARIDSSDLTSAGTYKITVLNPAGTGDLYSVNKTFTVT